ncbi:hypothetical protein [Helicobacter sp. T3_23-1056]
MSKELSLRASETSVAIYKKTKKHCHTEVSQETEVSQNFKKQTEIFRAHALNMTKKFSSLRADFDKSKSAWHKPHSYEVAI